MANTSKTVADAAGSVLEAVGLGSRKRGTPTSTGSQTFAKTHPDTTKYVSASDRVPATRGSTIGQLRESAKKGEGI
jgi:hypothetical protein